MRDKVDGVEVDGDPNNEPHPSCEFQVDFYGFDQGDYNARVDSTVIPLSRKDPRLISLDSEDGVNGQAYGLFWLDDCIDP